MALFPVVPQSLYTYPDLVYMFLSQHSSYKEALNTTLRAGLGDY